MPIISAVGFSRAMARGRLHRAEPEPNAEFVQPLRTSRGERHEAIDRAEARGILQAALAHPEVDGARILRGKHRRVWYLKIVPKATADPAKWAGYLRISATGAVQRGDATTNAALDDALGITTGNTQKTERRRAPDGIIDDG